jgi:hypothetical protein
MGKKPKNRTIIRTSHTTPGNIPESICTGIQRVTCTLMFTATLNTIVKLWKQSSCPTTDEWIKKM